MKRNKKFYKEKRLVFLKNQLEKNLQTQRNLGYETLDCPIHIGYEAYFDIRDDIKNRQDYWIFEFICINLSTKTFARKRSLFDWNKKKRFIKYESPKIISIPESAYNKLIPQIKKYFTKDIFSYNNGWNYHWYICTVPNFYFEIKYRKVYRTRVKIYDPILKQEESEIRSEINSKFYNNKRWRKNAPKKFRKHLNKKQRAKSKQILHNIVYKNCDLEFVDNYRNANWLWW